MAVHRQKLHEPAGPPPMAGTGVRQHEGPPLTPQPPLTAPAELSAQLAQAGWAVLDAAAVCSLCGVPPAQLAAWQPACKLPYYMEMKRKCSNNFYVQGGHINK